MPSTSDAYLDPRLSLIVIDDHSPARVALVRRLEAHHLARVAGHTDDLRVASELIAAHRPHVALIDPNRRDGLGRQVLASVAGLPPSFRPLIILHVAYFDAQEWAEARAAGADDLVLKRIGVESLVAVLLDAVRIALPPERWPAGLHA